MNDDLKFAPINYGEEIVKVPTVTLSVEEHAKLSKAALYKVWQKKYEDAYRQQIEDGEIKDPIMNGLINGLADKRKACSSTWVFLTINPDSDDKFELLQKAMQKCIKKKWVTEYIYVFEQRSEIKNNFSGKHCHAYIKRNDYPVCNLKREIKSTFKHVVGNDNAINFQFDGDKSWNNRIGYLLGHKDQTKIGKCHIDADWRIASGLDQYYADPVTRDRIEKGNDEQIR